MGLDGTVDTGLIQVQRAHTNYIVPIASILALPMWLKSGYSSTLEVFFLGFFFGDYHHLISCDEIIY